MTTFAVRALEFARRNDLVLYLMVVIATIALTTTALELWNLRWDVPIGYDGDAVLIGSHIKTDIGTGWYESQSLLGAPFGQVYHDWKSADNLHHMVVSALRFLIPDWGVSINVYYLVGFPLAAITATWFLRLVGVSRTITAALAVLFALAPYHFIRGEGHLWLASYYPIPLALGVVYLIAVGRPVWGKHSTRSGWLAWATGPTAFTLFALALVGSANSYYAFFTVLMIALAGLIRLVADRDWRRFVGAALAGIWTVIVMLLNMLPDLIYSWIHGSNDTAVGRFPYEAELYSLKFMQLVLPMPGHRVPILSSLRGVYDSFYPFTSESPALGIVAAFGFVAAFAIALYVLITRAKSVQVSPRAAALGILSALVIFAFLLSTFGGLSSLISFFTSDLRGWNRMSILIAMLSLAITGLAVDALLVRMARRSRAKWFATAAAGGMAAVLLLVGYLDQVSPSRVPNYAALQQSFDADAAMVSTIEGLVPTGSMILQLPFREFPETPPINGVFDTDQIKPNLHSDTLRWSGGAIKGRPQSEWVGLASVIPVEGFMRAVSAAGFAGVLVDRKSYDDNGAQIVSELQAALGPEQFSAQDRYVFFTLPADKLSDGASDSQLKDMGTWVTHPVFPRFTPDYSHGFSILGTFGSYRPQIALDNPRDESVRLRLTFDVSYTQGAAVMRFTFPDGSFVDHPVGTEPTSLDLEFDAPAGRSAVAFSIVEGPEPIKYRTDSGPIAVEDLTSYDVKLERLLEQTAPASAR